MNLNRVIEFLGVDDSRFGEAIDTLQIELKDDYTQEEVDLIQAHLSNPQFLPRSAPAASEITPQDQERKFEAMPAGYEPDRRIFGPPHPGLNEEIPVHRIGAYSLVKRVEKPAQLSDFKFDFATHEDAKAALEKEVNNRVNQLAAMASNYGKAQIARLLAEIDITVAGMRAEVFSQMGLTQTNTKEGRDD